MAQVSIAVRRGLKKVSLQMLITHNFYQFYFCPKWWFSITHHLWQKNYQIYQFFENIPVTKNKANNSIHQ